MEEIAQADGLVPGSPIYFGDVTGQMRTFQNRPSYYGAIYIGKRTFRRPLMLDGEWLAIRRLLFDKSQFIGPVTSSQSV